MSNAPFKVKAIYEYSSPHDDDLSFPLGQVINVTEEEDADWYVGEYAGSDGAQHTGLFPKNFVEKYEPEIPSRPSRPTRPKAAQQSPTIEAASVEKQEEPPPPLPAQSKPQPPPIEPDEESEEEPAPPPAVVREVPKAAPAPTAPKAVPTATKGPPPPVSEKPSSFRDRIAAFNKQDVPVTPFKPGGAPSTFVKKPFVAPPPSRNAYVPPPKAEAAPQKIYRREEDPEIAERQAQDLAAAEHAGLAGPGGEEVAGSVEAEAGEDAPKPQSLKDRIALLQKQQMEQAQRRSEVSQKEKPKKPAKKRTNSSERGPSIEEAGEPLEHIRSEEQTERGSEERPRERVRMPAARVASPAPMSPSLAREDILSDGNEADQSAAGETTEANEDTTEDEGDQTTRESIDVPRAAAAPVQEPDVGEEEDTTEGEVEEEDEVDEEERRRVELRQRMAKMSGGMGMAGMFGPQPGMAMSGPGVTKKRSTKQDRPTKTEEATPSSPPAQARVPMIPVPGMQHVSRPQDEQSNVPVTKEDEPVGMITNERGPGVVPDLEDVKPEPPTRSSTGRSSLDRPLPRAPTAERGVPPPVPGQRPVLPPAESKYTHV